jgi:hypothetical protein
MKSQNQKIIHKKDSILKKEQDCLEETKKRMAIKFIKAMLNKTQDLMRKEEEEISPFKELEN